MGRGWRAGLNPTVFSRYHEYGSLERPVRNTNSGDPFFFFFNVRSKLFSPVLCLKNRQKRKKFCQESTLTFLFLSETVWIFFFFSPKDMFESSWPKSFQCFFMFIFLSVGCCNAYFGLKTVKRTTTLQTRFLRRQVWVILPVRGGRTYIFLCPFIKSGQI